MTYEEFKAELGIYCKDTSQLFSIAFSKKLKPDNLQESDQESEDEDDNEFSNQIKSQIFRCIRFTNSY